MTTKKTTTKKPTVTITYDPNMYIESGDESFRIFRDRETNPCIVIEDAACNSVYIPTYMAQAIADAISDMVQK